MKNNKFIATSIASIMLVAGMAMPKALAATSTETRYAKDYIDSNSYAIAVGLANGNKVLTRSDLTDLVKTHGVTLNSVKDPSNKEITAASAQVPNGSKVILSDGNTATVVLYGDIEADGKIDLNDAQAIFDAYTGAKTVTGAALKAADIEVETSGEAKVDLADPQRLFDYLYNVSAMENDLVVATKKLPENNSTIDANINIELIEEYVNNVNEGAFAVKVNLNKALDKKTTYTLSVVDEEGKEVAEVSEVEAEFNTNKGDTVISVEKNLDFSSLGEDTDGTYTIVLKDADGNVVARKTVQKVSKSKLLPAAVKIETKRTGVHTAKLSFVGNGATEATKMYYAVVDINNTGSIDRDKLIDMTDARDKSIKTMAISGNKLDLTEIASELTEGTPYKVIFVVLDKYGNASEVAYTAVINDGNATEAEKKPTVVTMTASNKTAAESGGRTTGKAVGLVAEATPAENLNDSEKILFRLYDKSGNIVEEKEVAGNGANKVSVTFDVDKAGEYYVGALVVSTTGKRANSEELVDSESTVPVKQLTAPSAITFAEKTADATDKIGTISWVGVNQKTEKTSLKDYTVTFYKYDPENKEFVKDTDLGTSGVETITSATANPDENNRIKKEMTTFTPNVVYKVKIAANAVLTATDVIDSEETESEVFFILHASGLLSVKTGSVGTNSITLKVKKDEFAFEKEHTYDINIWTASSREGSDETASMIEAKKSVKISSTDDQYDYIVIDGLTENGVTYYFELVLNYDGKSDTATKADREGVTMNTNQVLPSLTDLTLVDKDDAEKGLQTGDDGISTLKTDNTICFDTNKVYIKKDGKDYYINDITATTNFEDPDKLLVALKEIKGGLKVSDYIKAITANKVTVELRTEGTAKLKASFRNFGTLENKSLEIVGNNFQQGIKAKVTGGDVILSPDKSNFDVTEVTVDEGHKIVAAKDVELYILDTSTHVMPSVQVTDSATICGVKVTGSTQYAVADNQSSITTFDVAASDNKLTFNNTADNVQGITVNVAQTADQKVSVQSGDIEVISNKDVKIAAKNTSARVEGKVAVTVTNANVDLTDTRLLGNKSITINYTDKAEHTIKFADNVLPDEFGKITDISEADTVALKTNYKTNDPIFTSITEDKKQAVVDFINSLGIEESYNAKIQVESNVVTIKFVTESAKDRNIKNLTINL